MANLYALQHAKHLKIDCPQFPFREELGRRCSNVDVCEPSRAPNLHPARQPILTTRKKSLTISWAKVLSNDYSSPDQTYMSFQVFSSSSTAVINGWLANQDSADSFWAAFSKNSFNTRLKSSRISIACGLYSENGSVPFSAIPCDGCRPNQAGCWQMRIGFSGIRVP